MLREAPLDSNLLNRIKSKSDGGNLYITYGWGSETCSNRGCIGLNPESLHKSYWKEPGSAALKWDQHPAQQTMEEDGLWCPPGEERRWMSHSVRFNLYFHKFSSLTSRFGWLSHQSALRLSGKNTKPRNVPRETNGSSFVGKWRMLFLLHEIALQWSSFTAEMKNQPGDKCFACKRASSSPRALYPASKEHWEAPSSLPQREQIPVDPFSWFTLESVLCLQFSPHTDGRTMRAALWEHSLYKDLERETSLLSCASQNVQCALCKRIAAVWLGISVLAHE